MALGKAVLIIGIAAVIILFVGPLGTLNPFTNFPNPLNPGGDSTGTGDETSTGDLSARGDSVGDAGTSTSKESIDEDGRALQLEKEKESPPDTDGDGVSDAEEESVGTDPTNPDTDNDGVSDRDERDRNTDPRNPNTDNDRRSDRIDPQPTVKNSAFVRVMTSKFAVEEDYTAMAAVILGPLTGSVNPSTQVARVTLDIVFENIGDDFTSFVKFDGVFHVDGLEVKRTSSSIGKLEIGQKITERFTYTVRVSDIPPEVINRIVRHVVEGSHPAFSFEIKNVDFEKF